MSVILSDVVQTRVIIDCIGLDVLGTWHCDPLFWADGVVCSRPELICLSFHYLQLKSKISCSHCLAVPRVAVVARLLRATVWPKLHLALSLQCLAIRLLNLPCRTSL